MSAAARSARAASRACDADVDAADERCRPRATMRALCRRVRCRAARAARCSMMPARFYVDDVYLPLMRDASLMSHARVLKMPPSHEARRAPMPPRLPRTMTDRRDAAASPCHARAFDKSVLPRVAIKCAMRVCCHAARVDKICAMISARRVMDIPQRMSRAAQHTRRARRRARMPQTRHARSKRQEARRCQEARCRRARCAAPDAAICCRVMPARCLPRCLMISAARVPLRRVAVCGIDLR